MPATVSCPNPSIATVFTVLGEVAARHGSAAADLGGARQRALLARLLLSGSEPIGRAQLADDVFGHVGNPAKALSVAISRLRRSLAGAGLGERLQTVGDGYLLARDRAELDADRMAGLAAEGDRLLAAQRFAAAALVMGQARELWHGQPLAGAAPTSWGEAAAERLVELRLRVVVARARALMALRRHEETLAELVPVLAEHPGSERVRGALMLARYRAGQQSEALGLYRDGHRLARASGGAGTELRQLAGRIAEHDPLLLGPAPQPMPARLRGALAGRLVGREAELVRLRGALQRAQAGEPGVIVISGEAGIGKTRLAAELGVTARAAGFTVLAGRCDEELGASFQPFAEALAEPAVTLPDALLRDHARAHGAALAPLVPALARRLGDHGVTVEPAIAGARQYAVFDAAADLLARIGDRAPVLLVIEDLQWAERPTLLLAKHLLHVAPGERLLIAFTFRTGAGGGHVSELLGDPRDDPGQCRIELSGLSAHELAELISQERPRDGSDPRLISSLHHATGGNPFFLTELLRAGLPSPDAASSPPSVREAIRGRTRRLGAATVSALSAAAVLGAEFEQALVAELVCSEPRLFDELADADPVRVSALLQDAVASEVLRAAVGGRMTFRHALIPQALEADLPALTRAELHRRAARAMQLRRSPAAHEVALHLTLAGGDEERLPAVHWALAAGREALSTAAFQQAQRQLELAISMHDATGSDDQRLRGEILIDLGAAQLHSGDAAFRQTLLQAARLGIRLGDAELLVRAAIRNTRGFVSSIGGSDDEVIGVLEQALEAIGPGRGEDRARLLATLAAELTFCASWERRATLSDEALQIARELGDPGALVHVLSCRYITIWRPETLAERVANSAECLRAAERLGDPVSRFHALFWRESALIETGRLREALAVHERMRALAERVREPTIMWMLVRGDADLATIAGRLEDSERRQQAAFALAQASGQPDASEIFASQLMVLRLDQGRLGELTELIAQTLQASPRLTGYRSVLALAYCERGELAEAARILASDADGHFRDLAIDLTWLSAVCAYAHVASRTIKAGLTDPVVGAALCGLLEPWTDQVAFVGPIGGRLVSQHLGMLEVALGRLDRGASHLRAAVAIAARLPAPIWEQRARVELARCLIAAGDRDGAAEQLRIAEPAAAALGADGIAEDARRLLHGRIGLSAS